VELLKYVNVNYPQLSLNDLATKARALMRNFGLRIIPIVEDSRLVGIVYRINVLSMTSSKSNLLVRNIVDEPKIVLNPNFSVREAVENMLKVDEWYAPVVDEKGNFIGIFEIDSVIREFCSRNILINNKPVKEIMTENVIYVNEDDELSTVFYKMLKHQYAGLPVVNKKKRVVGIITQHDLLKSGFTRLQLESERSGGYRSIKAKDIMSTDIVKVSPTVTVGEVAKLIVDRDIGRVIVVDKENKLLGIVDREDIVKVYLPYI